MKKFAAWLILGLFAAGPAGAQNYSIDWFAIAGGGGTSAGGNFSLSGTIGQAAASQTMSGGNFTLTGGFWSILSVVQTPGAPLLSITTSSGQAVISWPLTAGYVPQSSPSLASGNWTAAQGVQATNGAVVYLTVPITGGARFFRLQNGH